MFNRAEGRNRRERQGREAALPRAMRVRVQPPRAAMSPAGDDGFMLLGLVVAIFLILLALSVAAPQLARSLRRDRELETLRRADQYTRAIRLYYKRFGHYPASMEQLEKSNTIRFLRHRYDDPMTGKDDWRLIHIGEQKTVTRGFFGKPLAGVANAGLGAAAGLASPGGVGTPAGAVGVGGASGVGSAGSAFGSGSSALGSAGSAFGSAGSATGSSGSGFSLGPSGVSGSAGSRATDGGATGTSATAGAGNNAAGPGGAPGSGFGSNSGSSSSDPGGGPFLGIGVPKDAESILTVNEQTNYNTWEILYDPRVEQLRAGVNPLGGGMASTSAGSLGAASGMQSTFGANSAAGAAGAGANGAGAPTPAGGTTTPGSAPSGSTSPQ